MRYRCHVTHVTRILHCYWRKFWWRNTGLYRLYIIILSNLSINNAKLKLKIITGANLRFSGFSLYPLSFFLYSPFKLLLFHEFAYLTLFLTLFWNRTSQYWKISQMSPRLYNKVGCSKYRENVASYDRLIKNLIERHYRGESDVIWCLCMYIFRDDVFRTLERIESNQPYYATLDVTDDVYIFPISGWFVWTRICSGILLLILVICRY